MESMLRSDDMRCLFCDGKLPLHMKITNGQFCSADSSPSCIGKSRRAGRRASFANCARRCAPLSPPGRRSDPRLAGGKVTAVDSFSLARLLGANTDAGLAWMAASAFGNRRSTWRASGDLLDEVVPISPGTVSIVRVSSIRGLPALSAGARLPSCTRRWTS